ncbi:MAG: hypothetical protein ABL927_12235, partial [Bdellovibrionales bacterium]
MVFVLNLLVLIFSLNSLSAEEIPNITTPSQDGLKTIILNLKSKIASTDQVTELIQLKESIKNKKYTECIAQAKNASKKFIELRPWVLLAEIKCARSQLAQDKNYFKKYESLVSGELPTNDYIFIGAQARMLRTEWIDAKLDLISALKTKNKMTEIALTKKTKKIWKQVSQLQEIKIWLDANQKTRLATLTRIEPLQVTPKELS